MTFDSRRKHLIFIIYVAFNLLRGDGRNVHKNIFLPIKMPIFRSDSWHRQVNVALFNQFIASFLLAFNFAKERRQKDEAGWWHVEINFREIPTRLEWPQLQRRLSALFSTKPPPKVPLRPRTLRDIPFSIFLWQATEHLWLFMRWEKWKFCSYVCRVDVVRQKPTVRESCDWNAALAYPIITLE